MEDEHQDLTARLNETTTGGTTVNIQEVVYIAFNVKKWQFSLYHILSNVFISIQDKCITK